MRVQLKGINRVSKKLADGSRVTYFYAVFRLEVPKLQAFPIAIPDNVKIQDRQLISVIAALRPGHCCLDAVDAQKRKVGAFRS